MFYKKIFILRSKTAFWLISNWAFFLGLVLSLSLLWPLVAAPFFNHHDDVQAIRLYEMDKCFKDGQIPCRWVPDLGGLYGYPLFNYYAPLPYYFGELIFLSTKSLILSVKLMFAFSFIGSFVFMYLLATKFWGKLGGSLSAIFYSIAPYHALDFYVRGAMGEMWALMLFPAIFWAFIKLEEKPEIKNLLLVAIFLSLLLTSHNLSAMVFIPVTIIWAVFLFLRKKAVNFLLFTFFSFILSLLISAFYLLPVIFEKNLVHVDTTTVGYFYYTEHFKGFRRLFLERDWGYGPSLREVPGGEKDKMTYQIGWIHLLGWALALYACYKLWHRDKFLSITIILSSIVLGFSIFMINPRSQFIWDMIEPLKYLQFPWRFLLIVAFFISFISGSFFVLSNRKKWWIILIVLVVAFNFSYFKPEKFLQITNEELLSGKLWEKQIKRSIFDFLPIYAKEPPAELASSRYQILTGDSQISDFNEGTNWISFKAETKTHTIIRLSQYYFPDWKIFVDGSPIIFDYKNNSLGLMTFILGKGNHTIEARLYDTPIRSLSNLITLVGFGITVFLFFISFVRVRKWILYYRKGIN